MAEPLKKRMARRELEEQRLRHESQRHAMQGEIAELKRTVKALMKEADQADRVIAGFEHVLRRKKWPKPIRPRSKSSVVSESVLLALASDWHVEERVEASSVNRLNEYNPEIADRRAERYFQSIVRIAEMARAHTEVRTLVLWLGGDFVTGHLHEEGLLTTEMSPLEAIDFASGLIRRGVQFLVEHGGFERIVVPCSFGNHGRTSRKPYFSKASSYNLETFMYRQLAGAFSDPVEVSVSMSRLHEGVEVFGRRLRFHHGEDLRFQGGLQGLYGRLYKAHANWNRSTDCYLSCVGHWHQAKSFQDLGMTNGSLIGYSAYSQMLQCEFEKPRQMFALIDKDRGMSMSGPIYVEAA